MITRRHLLQATGFLTAQKIFALDNLEIAGQSAALRIAAVSESTLRLTIDSIRNGQPISIPSDGSLVQDLTGKQVALRGGAGGNDTAESGPWKIRFKRDTLTVSIDHNTGVGQPFGIDRNTGGLTFQTGSGPLLGFGEGGPQFDRRGSAYDMRSGQGGYMLRTHGGRVPIPWIISTDGWAIFFHQPFGTFDLTGQVGKFQPPTPALALPLDLFFVASREPATILDEYARLTGYPELPPLWAFGYQQSHRTLANREAILAEARTFREKKLPCDTLIYLGTGFCPSGWNTDNGEFAFNSNVFPDPKAMFDDLHAEHFKVVLHVVIKSRSVQGSVHDSCDSTTVDPKHPVEDQAGCYWNAHREIFSLGVDGWWPDEGDPLNIPSRLTRNRMYWEGPQIERPNERPFSLHRNGYAGMQRYASFLWSGDVYSTWETLRTHIPVAVNTGLSGIPYWGTDIGGFVPTKEFTAELFLRWFQFGAFCPLFRSHGRNWTLRLPWGWNTGDSGPLEINTYNGAALPDPSQLHNPEVERICRKYLELRYRMLPYLYSTVRESTVTGLPIMRALWLHYPDDPTAVARGDQYLWGPAILAAPVVEQGATSRNVYLPRGTWYDFWSNERHEGSREIVRKVDLETMPLYVRAGAILPLGPVKQYTGEQVDAPITIQLYPGADGLFLLYEDDGRSFDYRKGAWTGIEMKWSDSAKSLRLSLSKGSRISSPRKFEVKLQDKTKSVTFNGRSAEVKF